MEFEEVAQRFGWEKKDNGHWFHAEADRSQAETVLRSRFERFGELGIDPCAYSPMRRQS